MHYFKYQVKLEMLPYVEQQIHDYLSALRKQLKAMDESARSMAYKAITKKLSQLEEFYERNYADYRACIVLRARKTIIDFMVEHATELGGIQKQSEAKEIVQAGKTGSKDEELRSNVLSESKFKPLSSRGTKLSSQRQNKLGSNLRTPRKQQKQRHIKTEDSEARPNVPAVTMLPQSRPANKNNPKQIISIKSGRVQQARKEPVRKISKNQYINFLKEKQNS